MKSFAAILVAALLGAVGAFAPHNQLAGVSRGSSVMTMNAAERTYIMVRLALLHPFSLLMIPSISSSSHPYHFVSRVARSNPMVFRYVRGL
jgi:hypothetical protein